MDFYIIYSFETSSDNSVKDYEPPKRKKLWRITESFDNQKSEYDSGLWNGRAKHRKYVGELTREQFAEFLNHTGLFPEDVETLGSLTGYGILPAISFRSNDPEAIQSAYVTPFPKRGLNKTPKQEERNWNRIKQAILNVYK